MTPDGVAVLGYAENTSERGRGGNLERSIFSTASAALAASGITRSDLDAVVLAASDQTDGRAISSMLTSGPAGAYLLDEINIASSPGHALAVTWMSITAGLHDRVLVSSWGSASELATEGGSAAAERLSVDPYFERTSGLSSLAAAGMQAMLQRERRGGEAGAHAVVRTNRSNGAANERAVLRTAIDDDEISSSPLVAHPLRLAEQAYECDGTFALVLCRGDAVPAGAHPVWLQGIAWRCDSGRLDSRDLVSLPHLRAAADDAYTLAGVVNPRADLDVVEVHDYSADAELLACEALNLCDEGEAPLVAAAGRWGFDDELVVNPSGGSIAGEAPFGGPLRKVIEAARQLRGDAGAVQVPGAARAVAQITSGFAGQFQTVVVLGSEQP